MYANVSFDQRNVLNSFYLVTSFRIKNCHFSFESSDVYANVSTPPRDIHGGGNEEPSIQPAGEEL